VGEPSKVNFFFRITWQILICKIASLIKKKFNFFNFFLFLFCFFFNIHGVNYYHAYACILFLLKNIMCQYAAHPIDQLFESWVLLSGQIRNWATMKCYTHRMVSLLINNISGDVNSATKPNKSCLSCGCASRHWLKE